MASKNFSGVLRDPLGDLASKDKYRFTHVSTTGEVIRGSTSYLNIGNDGVYDIDIEYGNVTIDSYSQLGKRWINQGTTTINADTVVTTLPALLNALVPAIEPLLLELQALLADAEQAASDATDSAQAAEDALSSKLDTSYMTLKIFQSPTDGGLTEIQTRTVNSGEVYEVRKTCDNSLATIYSDAVGTVEIVQNGIDNKSGSDGVVEFFIADGDYYVEVNSVKGGLLVSKLKPFLTVSDMVSAAYLSKYAEGTRIEWQGYYEQSDGGSNWGVLKFGAHTEDGGSIFSIDSNAYVEANLKGKRVSVLKFGVVGDGVTDSTSRSQLAVNSGAKIITLDEGVFVIQNLTLPYGVGLSGIGKLSVIKSTSELNTISLLGDNCVSKIRFEKTASWSGASGTGCHIRADSVGGIVNVGKCEFSNHPFQGVSVVDSENITVSKCLFENGNYEAGKTDQSDIGISNSGIVRVSKNKCYSSNDSGVNVARCSDVIISGNFTANHVRHGIVCYEMANSGNTVINGNISKNNGWIGIYANNQNRLSEDNSANVIISNNTCSNNGDSGDGANKWFQGGISLYFVANGVISGNTIKDNSSSEAIKPNGIIIRDNRRVSVSSNVIDNIGGVGIYHSSSLDNTISIQGNIIKGAGEDGIQSVEGGPSQKNSNMNISGNIIKECLSGINLKNVKYLNANNNNLTMNLEHGIFITDCDDLTCSGNTSSDNSQTNPLSGDFSGIYILRAGNATVTSNVLTNTVDGEGNRFGLYYNTVNNGDVSGNIYSNNRTNPTAISNVGNVEGLTMTSPPSNGSWSQGYRVYKSNPLAGQYTGWVCVTGGTPGAWKGFGLIEA